MANLRLLRHATLLLDQGDVTFLVDPMLGEPGSIPPIPNSPNDRENPLVPLPDIPLTYDAVIVTHRHRDHFDDAARERLDRDRPLLCQPEEAAAFREEGFADVRPVDEMVTYEGIEIARTPARHGHGAVAEEMAPASGFVLDAEQTVYLAGDSVWYERVPAVIDEFEPDAVILNAGAAQFVDSEPITMDLADVRAVREYVDDAVTVVADHMDAINHCLLTREMLREGIDGVSIPEDGERVAL
ncbi:MAG: MBL fold metallo-hydrolase [Haloarculaceae archaeon]